MAHNNQFEVNKSDVNLQFKATEALNHSSHMITPTMTISEAGEDKKNAHPSSIRPCFSMKCDISLHMVEALHPYSIRNGILKLPATFKYRCIVEALHILYAVIRTRCSSLFPEKEKKVCLFFLKSSIRS